MNLAPAEEVLILVIDAIPWAVAREVWQSGGLPGFFEPRPMVSVFPSLTNVALAALLSSAIDLRPPGYEARWVDPATGALRGALGRTADEPALSVLRVHREGLLAELVQYAFREEAARRQLQWITDEVLRDGAPWLGYLSATDAVGHFAGRDVLVATFRQACAGVAAVREAYARMRGRELSVLLCSDHGMSFDCRHYLSDARLAAALTAGGFTRGVPRGCGFQIAPLGDVAAGAVWTDPAAAVEAAWVVACVEGVELVVAREGPQGARVVRGPPASRQEAHIAWDGDRYRYDRLHGDPLELEARVAPLRDPDGWLRDADLLGATWDARLPDALARIRVGLTSLCRHPATVLFAMAPGWTYGRELTHRLAELVGGQVGTHGGLVREQSLGFVAGAGGAAGLTALSSAPAVRAHDVLRGLVPHVRQGSAWELV